MIQLVSGAVMIIDIPPELPTMRPYTCPDLETDKPTEIWDFIHKNRDLEQFKTTRPLPQDQPHCKGPARIRGCSFRRCSEMCIRQHEMMWQKKLQNHRPFGVNILPATPRFQVTEVMKPAMLAAQPAGELSGQRMPSYLMASRR